MIKLSRPNITQEAINAVSDVLTSGMLVQGEKVLEFEAELQKFINVKYVSAVSSGTAALHLALEALGIGKGDAVIVPDFTFVATANVVELQKARTVLVDVDPTTYNMCPEKLEEAIINYNFEEKLKAIIVVHEFGAPANMMRVMEIAKKYNLYVIEDAACALGAYHNGQHVGTFGDIGCFSFHPRKSITTGEGGALITNNSSVFEKVQLLRNHGVQRDMDGMIDVLMPGYNYRMTDFQAVMGIVQLKNFGNNLRNRKNLVDYYLQLLDEVEGITLPEKLEGHAWQSFMIVIDTSINRSTIIKKMKELNIECGAGAQSISNLSYYKLKYHPNYFETSELAYNKGLVLPLDSNLLNEDINKICECLVSILREEKNGN